MNTLTIKHPVHGTADLLPARETIASNIRDALGRTGRVHLPDNYALLIGTDRAGNTFPLTWEHDEQTRIITQFRRAWDFHLATNPKTIHLLINSHRLAA